MRSSPSLPSLFLPLAAWLFSASLSAQPFGGMPPSFRWRQVNTDSVRVVFPLGLEPEAKRVAGLVHWQARTLPAIGTSWKKIDVLLEPATTQSNGYVGLAPWRSEFYLTAPQEPFSLGGLHWADNLVIHELRHVQQYSNFNHGPVRLLSTLFGEAGEALAIAGAVPDWFFEGDAVYNETALSTQGRGRLPLFVGSYQSLWLARKSYSYMKLRNGSLKDYVPDHYPLGYMMVTYGREKYGPEIWRKITADAIRYPGLFYPWQHAIAKETGISFRQFANDAFDSYRKQWSDRLQPRDTAAWSWVTRVRKNQVSDYRYPYSLPGGGWLVAKSGLRQAPAFYLINADGGERRLAGRYPLIDEYFSYNNGRIVYSAYYRDARYGNREFSDIVSGEISGDGERISQHRITHGGRYFSPDISHEGTRIAAVVQPVTGGSEVVLLDSAGRPVSTIAASKDLLFTFPKFSRDDRSLFLVARTQNGRTSILKIPLDGSTCDTLASGNFLAGYPVVTGDTLWFTCSSNGFDELRMIAPGRAPVTAARYATGVYQGVPAAGGICASLFTANGYRLATAPLENLPVMGDSLPILYQGQAAIGNVNNVNPPDYPVTKYHPGNHLFRFHSLEPYYSNPNFSLTLVSDNTLNTMRAQVGYDFNQNESSHAITGQVTYGGWFLQPFVGVSQTFRRNTPFRNDSLLYWNETQLIGGVQLPLVFITGRQVHSMTTAVSWHYDEVDWTGIAKSFLRNTGFGYGRLQYIYYGYLPSAPARIFPPLAELISLDYQVANSKIEARQFLASGSLFLPGIGPTHSLQLDVAWQGRDTLGQYGFSNNFPISRGYTRFNYPRMLKFGAEYHFPLAYPDAGVANLVYFKRIRAGIFYDESILTSLRLNRDYHLRSTGLELFFDTRWFNLQPVSFGIRYSRLLDAGLAGQKPDQWDLVLPITVF